jgi:hypothetical protein
MTPEFQQQAERHQVPGATERRLVLLVACVTALIGGAVLGMTELMRDPDTGAWLGEGMDRLMTLFSVCR